MPRGDQVSRPQQPPLMQSLLPPANLPDPNPDPNSLEARRGWVEDYFRRANPTPPGITTGPSTGAMAKWHEYVAQHPQPTPTPEQMREGQGMYPAPQQFGPNSPPLKLGPDTPLDNLWGSIEERAERYNEAVRNFPEVFGNRVPEFLRGTPIDDQWMLWDARLEDQHGRDRQLPWNTPDPGALGL
jgi:hypothetical protein